MDLVETVTTKAWHSFDYYRRI